MSKDSSLSDHRKEKKHLKSRSCSHVPQAASALLAVSVQGGRHPDVVSVPDCLCVIGVLCNWPRQHPLSSCLQPWPHRHFWVPLLCADNPLGQGSTKMALARLHSEAAPGLTGNTHSCHNIHCKCRLLCYWPLTLPSRTAPGSLQPGKRLFILGTPNTACQAK